MQMYSTYDAFHIDNISSIADCIFVVLMARQQNEMKSFPKEEARHLCFVYDKSSSTFLLLVANK